jgi:GNAT superfamily N-acetyltransferase
MLVVRPFEPDDATDWSVLEGDAPRAVATARGMVVGAIYMQARSIDWIVARFLDDTPVVCALVGWARAEVGSPLWGSTFCLTARDPQEGVYRDLGFRTAATLVHVERSIAGYVVAPADLELELVPHAEVEPAAFQSLFTAALDGTANRLARGADPAAQLAELGGDTCLWAAVRHRGRDVGVVMPRVDAKTGIGIMDFIGVVAAHRRAGLGKRLHRLGLARLADAGATEYRDMTDADNCAMRRVFASNDCPVLGFEHRYRLGEET